MKLVRHELILVVPDSVSDADALAEMGELTRDLGDVELQITAWGIVETPDKIEHIESDEPPARPYGPETWSKLTPEQAAAMDEWSDNVYAWQRFAESVVLHSLGLPCTKWSHAAMHEYMKHTTCPVCNEDIRGYSL